MFKNMATIDDVERIVRILDISDIHPHHCRWIEKVRREIASADALSQQLFELRLGSDVQNLLFSAVEEIRFLFEI